MGTKELEDYQKFLLEFDLKLESYFKNQSNFILCKKGCSACCANGDYPISELELRFLMCGFADLDSKTKIRIQQNFKNMVKGGQCPFLLESECSIYSHRPIICRVHGLSYLCKNNVVKVPYCVNAGLNYSSVYADNELTTEPIQENLDTQVVLQDFEYGEIRNLYDWLER